MANILIICTANICRSPVVAALLKERLSAQGLTDWEVTSAGTWASNGQAAAEYSVLLMAEQGIDISDHASKPVDFARMKNSDLVLTLEIGHAEALRAEFPDQGYKVFTLTEMSGKAYSVKDPFGGPKTEYQRMVAEVTELIDKGLPRIIELASANAAIRT